MSTADEFKAVLALQNEIDQKLDELLPKIKALKDANRDRSRITVKIDGELYELMRIDAMRQAIDSCRKHGGFFSEYRLIKVPDPIQ